jgi:hypothetical protein
MTQDAEPHTSTLPAALPAVDIQGDRDVAALRAAAVLPRAHLGNGGPNLAAAEAAAVVRGNYPEPTTAAPYSWHVEGCGEPDVIVRADRQDGLRTRCYCVSRASMEASRSTRATARSRSWRE